jgi:hypothetical protein
MSNPDPNDYLLDTVWLARDASGISWMDLVQRVFVPRTGEVRGWISSRLASIASGRFLSEMW